MKKYLIIAFLMILTTSSFGAYYSVKANLFRKGSDCKLLLIDLPNNCTFFAQCDAYSTYNDKYNNFASSMVSIYPSGCFDYDSCIFELWNETQMGGSMTVNSPGSTGNISTYANIYAMCRIRSSLPGYVTAEAYITW